MLDPPGLNLCIVLLSSTISHLFIFPEITENYLTALVLNVLFWKLHSPLLFQSILFHIMDLDSLWGCTEVFLRSFFLLISSCLWGQVISWGGGEAEYFCLSWSLSLLCWRIFLNTWWYWIVHPNLKGTRSVGSFCIWWVTKQASFFF